MSKSCRVLKETIDSKSLANQEVALETQDGINLGKKCNEKNNNIA